MKKTKLMRAALLLLVLTLITSCFVGGTFAKYVTKGNSTDSARVAKWGVEIAANGETFAKEYDSGATIKTVISTKNVVAPGTSGSMAKMTLTGTPEVAVKVSYVADFTVTGWAIDNNTYYCPLVITVNGTEFKGTDYTSAEDFKAKVETAINGYSKNYAANINLAGQGSDSLDISWKWAFEGNDENDTKLGNLETAPTVSLKVTTTVTQID